MENGVTILREKDIDRILTRIASEILEKHKGPKNLALIGIQTRGVYLARRIRDKVREMEAVDLETGNLDINLYRDDWTRIAHHPVVRDTDIPFEVDGREIILVDDVLFTGRTVRAALQAMTDYGRPDRIELAVLVERGHRELPIEANYVGKKIFTKRDEIVNVFMVEHDEGDDRVVINTLSE